MTDPIALAVAFPGNLETKNFKISFVSKIKDKSRNIFEIKYRRWILAFAVASHKNLEVYIFFEIFGRHLTRYSKYVSKRVIW